MAPPSSTTSDLDGGIAAAVENFAGDDVGDGGHGGAPHPVVWPASCRPPQRLRAHRMAGSCPAIILRPCDGESFLHALDQHGDPLADADAHGGDGALACRGSPAHAPRSAPAARRTCPADGRARWRRRSGSRARRRPAGRAGAVTARPCAAKASFSSITSISASFSPSRSSSFCVAGAGPMPMMRGATPAVAIATTRARGVRPCLFAAASEAMISAAAPSFTPEALPAVTVPPCLRNGVGSLASASSVVSPRGCSSWSTGPGRPCGRRSHRRDLPREEAAGLRRLGAHLAAAARRRPGRRAETWKSSATFSAGLRHRIDAVLLSSSAD